MAALITAIIQSFIGSKKKSFQLTPWISAAYYRVLEEPQSALDIFNQTTNFGEISLH